MEPAFYLYEGIPWFYLANRLQLQTCCNSPAFSVRKFLKCFPDDDACLAHIMEVRFGGTRFVCGSCGKEATHHKLKERRTYVCAACGPT